MSLALSRLARLVRSLGVRAGRVTFRFPSAAAAICAIAAIANIAIASAFDATDSLARVLLALTAGAAASIAASLFAESRGASLGAARIAGLGGLALVGSAVGFAQPFLLHGSSLTIAIVTAVPLAPFIARGSSRSFWDFALWTVLGVTLGWFSVVIFLLGFTAIFEMVRTLFGIGLGRDAYAHLFTTGLTFVGPLFALGRIPHPLDVREHDHASERLQRAVRPLFEWVTAPLVIVAGLIIHVYAAKIALTGDVPSNEIGWIVLLYSGFTLALRIGLEPYRLDLSQPARFFARFWAALLVAPLLLFAYALDLRIGSEGWTIERYFGAAYGLAAGIAVVLQAWSRTRSDIRFLVAVPPILLALSIIGPWGVAETVGRSQQSLIERDYADALGGGPDTARGLDGSARATLLSRLSALAEVDQTNRMTALLASFSGDAGEERVASLRQVLEEGAAMDVSGQQEIERSFSIDGGWDVGGFDRVFAPLSATVGAGAEGAMVRLEGHDLVVTYRQQTDRFALASALEGLPQTGATLPQLVLDLRSQDGRDIRFRVTHARWTAQGDPVFLQGWLALRHGEWASLR